MGEAGRARRDGEPDADRIAGLEAALAHADERIHRLTAAERSWQAERARLLLRTQELHTALRERHEAFLDMLDRLQEREEQEVQRTLRELWRSEERFRLLVESVQDYAIFMLDPEGRIASWSPGAERVIGYAEDEVLGRHLALFHPPEEDPDEVDDVLRTAAETGRHEGEGWRVRKDGTRFWANTVITALRDEDGALLGFAKITRDLTERMQQQRALEENTAQLEELTAELEQTVDELRSRTEEAEAANRAKSDFLAVMSHELRTPLNAIIGYSDLLDAGVAGSLTDKQGEQVSRIQNSAAHLLQLIEEILTYARVEAGREEVHHEPVDFTELVRSVAQLVEPLAAKKGLDLRVDVPNEPVEIESDAGKVRQILLNLLSNAVKFTEQGEVRCRAWRDGGRVFLEVSDTGIGIAPEHLERVFAPFWQVEQAKTRRAGGTGLGLSVTRRLARLLGGDVWVESEPGEGSTFTVELPAG